MTELFSGSRLKVNLIERSNQHLCVTFDFMVPGKTEFGSHSGYKNLEQNNWSHISVHTKRNDWFLNAELPAVLEVLTKATKSYSVVVAFGVSMGGYAAMRASSAINATRVVAVSPQFSMDVRKAPFENRWSSEIRFMNFQFDNLKNSVNKKAELIIVYDPFDRLDRLQADLIRTHFKWCNSIPLPMGGHPATKVIRSVSNTAAFSNEILFGEANKAKIFKLHKNSRRRSASYWMNISNCARPKHRQLASDAIDKAMICYSESIKKGVRRDMSEQFKLGSAAAELGNKNGLLLMESALYVNKNPPPWWSWKLGTLRETFGDLAQRHASSDRTDAAERSGARSTNPIDHARVAGGAGHPRPPAAKAPISAAGGPKGPRRAAPKPSQTWWRRLSSKLARALRRYRPSNKAVDR